MSAARAPGRLGGTPDRPARFFASAQEFDDRWYLTGSVGYNVQDSERDTDDAPFGAIGFGKFINPNWSFDVELNYQNPDQGDTLCLGAAGCSGDDLTWSQYGISFDTRYHFVSPERSWNPYLLAGLGYLGLLLLLMPVLPGVEDSDANILAVVRAAANAGARFVYASFGVTMRDGQREYLLNGLDAAFPERGLAQKYRSRYGLRYYCGSPRARHLWQVFTAACAEYGLLTDMPDIIRAYRAGRESNQLSLFDTL